MSTETETATPAAQASAEQEAQVEQTSSEATTEQTEQETESQEPKKEPWFQKRIGELTREKYEAKRAADEARREAEQYREHLAQLQQGTTPETGQVDVTALARQEAARMLAEERFTESCNKAYSQGKAEFQDFDQAVSNLQMVGANRDFLELATSSEVGHKVLHHLGRDLDEAARILSLPPVQMARELTKLEFRLTQTQAPKPVSKAPAPITPLSSSKVVTKAPGDMTDAEYAEWRKSARK